MYLRVSRRCKVIVLLTKSTGFFSMFSLHLKLPSQSVFELRGGGGGGGGSFVSSFF